MSSILRQFGIRVTEDENCRSTKELHVGHVTRHRTWRQRFVDGPVWRPKKATYQSLGMVGVPTAYTYTQGNRTTIIAHPEIAARMRREFRQ